MVQAFGKLCSISQFYDERPRWVKKPKQESSLCPYCYGMKLFMIPCARMLEQVRAAPNKCKCSFCEFHKGEAAAHVAVPRHYSDLFKRLFCPKHVAPTESGFSGNYPCYKPCCLLKLLKPSDRKKIPGIIECENCCNYINIHSLVIAIADLCNRLNTFGTKDKSRFQGQEIQGNKARLEKSTNGPRYLGLCLHMNSSHSSRYKSITGTRYRVDWQDEFGKIIYSLPRPGRTVLAMDFGMSWEMCNAQERKQDFFQHETVIIHSCASYSEWPAVMKVIKGKHGVQRLDGLFGLSDDPKHDPVFVEEHVNQMIKIFDTQRKQDGRCEMDWLVIVTDGGPGHYKQRKNFYNWNHQKPLADLGDLVGSP